MIRMLSLIFFCNETAPTDLYTLSLHDALPISRGTGSSLRLSHPFLFPETTLHRWNRQPEWHSGRSQPSRVGYQSPRCRTARSEEHTSELQSQFHLVCRLLLEKTKRNQTSAQRQ